MAEGPRRVQQRPFARPGAGLRPIPSRSGRRFATLASQAKQNRA
jgi:hypothetical protein